MNILLLMMGGSGVRFGADRPKQFVLVEDQPIFSYILKRYDECACIDRIIVVTHADWKDYVQEWADRLQVGKLHAIVAGGSTRSNSVKNGLSAAADFAGPEDVVLIHDATHPYVDEAGTEQIIDAVMKYGGATLGQRQYDTVYRMDPESHLLKEVVPRSEIVAGASPEAFRFGLIYPIYTESTQEELERMTCAGAIALEHGIRMQVVDANVLNLKITYKGDMELFEQLCRDYFFPS